VFVTAAPTLLVARREYPFLVLEDGISVAPNGAPTFRLAYLASTDPASARGDELQRRATFTGALILEVMSPLLAPEVRSAELTAVFGGPGRAGVSLPVRFGRTAALWDSAFVGTTGAVVVPALPFEITRSVPAELAAVDAARRFLERADEGDYDATWELTSAVVKVSTSRNEFIERVRVSYPPAPRQVRTERLSRYVLRAATIGMGDVIEVVFDRADGIDAVHVRLDDDQQWRVALVARRSVTRPPASSTAAPGDAPAPSN
jgi:hypothetical protein